MKAKLNLSIDPQILKQARDLSRRQGLSVSTLFEKLILLHANNDASSSEGWLDGFYKRNQKKLSQIAETDIQKWMQQRGDKF